jgi:hypothetical protein
MQQPAGTLTLGPWTLLHIGPIGAHGRRRRVWLCGRPEGWYLKLREGADVSLVAQAAQIEGPFATEAAAQARAAAWCAQLPV